VKAHFTDAALEHLDAIYGYVSRSSPYYAQRVIDKITERVRNAALMPRAAAVVPEYGRDDVRELYQFNYRIIYQILPDRIDVLAILHGARPLPPSLDDIV
jgi:plasmid stabilization system protein ParE